MSANIKQLSANPRNPRKIEKKKLQMLAKSMLEFGSLDGFIYNVRTKRLAGGHQRQKVMPDDAHIFVEKRHERPTGAGTVAEGYVEWMGERWPYREVDWDESREMAANVAANKGAGEWDMTKLQEFVVELDENNFDLDLTMFDSDELKDLFGKEFGSDASKDAIEDEVPEIPKEPISKLGDLYEIGNHRLLCGDSTDLKSVECLMDGEKADMAFTDPPYGVNYDGGIQFTSDGVKKGQRKKIAGDDSADIYTKILPILSGNVNGPVYTWYADSHGKQLYNAIEDIAADYHAMIVWVKDGGYGALNACYKQKHEPCVFWKPKGSTLRWNGPTTENTIWEMKKDKVNKLHPTQKPVELAERAINNHDAKTCLDLFGGSGSTLIACEKTNRKCYMMELDPNYIDVIISRWVKYTGIQDIKKNGQPMKWVALNS